MSMGFLYGPMSHVWYKILDGYLPATNLKTVAKKIVVDQAVAGPIFCSAFFMGKIEMITQNNYFVFDMPFSRVFHMIFR